MRGWSWAASGWFIVASLSGCRAGSPPALRLVCSSPQEREVVQRNNQNVGSVLVQGRVECRSRLSGPLRVTVFRRRPGRADERIGGASEAFEAKPPSAPFSLRVTVPAGGWYKVLVLFGSPDQGQAGQVVHRVGVGEVFVTAGQSNAANSGPVPMTPDDDRVSAYDAVHQVWQWGRDPQPVTDGKGGSAWPVLGSLLVQRLNVPIGFTSVARGCTSVLHWSPDRYGDYFYRRLRHAVQSLGPHGVRAVLWHQGETDAQVDPGPCSTAGGVTERMYHDSLKGTIDRLNRDAGYRVLWYVAQTTYSRRLPGHPDPSAQFARIRAGQKSLWLDGSALPGPDTDAMDLRFRLNGWNHFTEAGVRELARLWYEALLRHPPWPSDREQKAK